VVEIVGLAPHHLDGVLRLCAEEGWPSFPADPARALRALTAPGVTSVVAIREDEVVGFAQVLSDGEIQSYLALLSVDRRFRRQGIAQALLREAAARAGGVRIDLLSEETAAGFYERLPHRRKPGYRIFPPFSVERGDD
jgi:ribosomal protein S18 acetylase RimI-like enzyme